MNQKTIQTNVGSDQPRERERALSSEQDKAHRPQPGPASRAQWTPPSTPIPAMQQAAELRAAPAQGPLGEAPACVGPFGEAPEIPNASVVQQAQQMAGPDALSAASSASAPVAALPDANQQSAVPGGETTPNRPGTEPNHIEGLPGAQLIEQASSKPAEAAPLAPTPMHKKVGGGGSAPDGGGAVDVGAPVLLDDEPADQDHADDAEEETQDTVSSDDDGAIEDAAGGDADDVPDDDGGGDELPDEGEHDPSDTDAPRSVADQLAEELPVARDYVSPGASGGGAIVDEPEPEPVKVAGVSPEAGLGMLVGKRPDIVANAMVGMGESVKAAVAEKRDALTATPPTSKSLTGPKAHAKGRVTDAPLPTKKAAAEAGADVPTPEPAQTLEPRTPPAADKAQAPPIRGGGDGGKLDESDVAKMEASIDALPTSDPELNTNPGPPPRLTLAGNADPASARKTKGQVDGRLDHLDQAGARDLAAKAPDESIPTEIPDAEVIARIPQGSPQDGADLGHLTADGSVGKMATEIDPDTINTAIGQAQGELVKKNAAQAAEEEKLRLDAKTSVDQLHVDANADQAKQRAEANKAIGAARAQWKKGLDKTHLDAKRKAATELKAGLGEIDKKKLDAEKESAKHLDEGEKKAAEARRAGEKDAQAHKKGAKEKKSGFWGWVASKAKAFFDGIKKKITQAMNWARKKVKQAIAWAKKAAKAVIEKARKWIVDKIKLVGKALIAIGDAVLAAYPELRDKYRKAIREKVDAAVNAVNDAAKTLEKNVSEALDSLGKGIDKGLAVLEKGLHMLVDGVGAVVQGVIDNARKMAEALGTFATLFTHVASDPIGWIKNLGAAIMAGLKNFFWGAFKKAVKAWFQDKLLEVLGIGGVIIKLLISDGGLTMEKIGQMTWDALKAMIPAALIGILVTKLVSMIVPAAGAVIAIIEGLQAAWGTVSRIIVAIDLFMKFLKAVKSGQAAKPFAESLAAAGVVVLDFVSNWLLKKIGPAGRGVGKKFKKKAKGLKKKPNKKGPTKKAAGKKAAGKKAAGKKAAGKKAAGKKTPGKKTAGKKKKDKHKKKDQAILKRAAQKAAGAAWSKAKKKAGKTVVKQSALSSAIKSAGGRVKGATVKVKVTPSGTTWKVTATAKKKGRVATSSKGKGWIAKGENGARWFTTKDHAATNKKLIKQAFKTLKKKDKASRKKAKAAKPDARLRSAYQERVSAANTLEKRMQTTLNRRIRGLKFDISMEPFSGVKGDKKIRTKIRIAPNMNQDEQDVSLEDDEEFKVLVIGDMGFEYSQGLHAMLSKQRARVGAKGKHKIVATLFEKHESDTADPGYPVATPTSSLEKAPGSAIIPKHPLPGTIDVNDQGSVEYHYRVDAADLANKAPKKGPYDAVILTPIYAGDKTATHAVLDAFADSVANHLKPLGAVYMLANSSSHPLHSWERFRNLKQTVECAQTKGGIFRKKKNSPNTLDTKPALATTKQAVLGPPAAGQINQATTFGKIGPASNLAHDDVSTHAPLVVPFHSRHSHNDKEGTLIGEGKPNIFMVKVIAEMSQYKSTEKTPNPAVDLEKIKKIGKKK